MSTNKTQTAVDRRVRRVRSKLMGTSKRPRLSVTRTNKHIHVQLIDDLKHTTLTGLTSRTLKTKGTKTEKAVALGAALAEKAKEAGIKEAVFDRGRFRFHGRVKALAQAAREAGLKM